MTERNGGPVRAPHRPAAPGVVRPAPPTEAPRAPTIAQWRADLAVEARRLGRRYAVAVAVASRCEAGARGLGREAAERLSARARRRASRLRVGFHRLLDELMGAGGFDEALTIVGERRGARPGAGPARAFPQGDVAPRNGPAGAGPAAGGPV